MPELPEVETVRRSLEPLVQGKKLLACEILDPKLKCRALSALEGTVTSLSRHGKNLIIEFRTKGVSTYLGVHLRMTGNLIWQQKSSRPKKLSEKYLGGAILNASTPQHLRARLAFAGGELQFIDARRFGTLQVVKKLSEFGLKGVDLFTGEISEECFAKLLSGNRQELKSWLLRQDKIAGIGNIYASEILFAARLRPFRLTSSLKNNESRELYRHTLRVLEKAILHCGTTFSDFHSGTGEEGNFQRFLKVYGREGEPCRRCRTGIRRVLKNQRSTFFCPNCQR